MRIHNYLNITLCGKRIHLLFLLLSVSVICNAEIKLANIFSDNMVLQQRTNAPIWGSTAPNKEVTVVTSWNSAVYKAKADIHGKWQVKVQTPDPGGPYKISFSDGKKMVLNNVLIGEVWICSGQSNMEMPVAGWGKVNDFEKEIAEANLPGIRLLRVERATNSQPSADLKVAQGGWQECSPKTVAEFSAVGYFFGRNLHQNLDVPIGLISTSWGGTKAEAWTSAETLENMPYFKETVAEIKKQQEEDAQKTYDIKIKEWNAHILFNDKGYKNDYPLWADMQFDDSMWKKMNMPELWNGNLSGFDGIVWFRKTIEIPGDWIGEDLEIRLGKIDDMDITYFNGVEIGQTNNYNVLRIYKVPKKLVKQGKAVIAVRMTDIGGEGGIRGESADIIIAPLNKKHNSILIAGNWNYQPSINFKEHEKMPQPIAKNPHRPTVLYNAMINPLVPYSMRGVIWYQGESNAEERGSTYRYRELFPLMIRDWRKQWSYNFPFYYVQLANFRKQQSEPESSLWAELREAQLKTLNLENTGMAIAIDLGDANDIHPKNKQDVGLRLASIARAKTYSQKNPYSGPIYDSFQIEGNKIRIKFKYSENGLRAKNNQQLKGFAIAGCNHVFHWADAFIDGNDVVVSSTQVLFPLAVRYAWADNPDCDLYNNDNLPASPFRTDDWNELTVEERK